VRFDREPWVKLYRAESPQHRLKPLEARMFRDFLLRYAEEDGLLLASSKNVAKDLCRVIGTDGSDARKVAFWIQVLVDLDYLSATKDGCLRIVKFEEAQAARSPGARRQKAYRDRQRDADGASHSDDMGDASSNATRASRVTSQREEKRREGEENPQTPSGGLDSADLRERCRAALLNEYEARYREPHRWPEVVEAAEILHQGLGFTGKPPLGQFPKDSGVKRIVELFEAGFTIEDIKTAKPKLLEHGFLKSARKLHAVTPSILREVLSGTSSAPSEGAYSTP
jgi:hypothetical protein